MATQVTYLDNAATTYPKPDPVYTAMDSYFRQAANPGRGAHRLAMESARIVYDARLAVAELVGISTPERLVFTPGCTYSINTVLRGTVWDEGDVIITTALEHNSVMRPLRYLEENFGVKVECLQYTPRTIINLRNLVDVALHSKPKLAVFTEASNVTGEVLDLPTVAAVCAANKIPLAIDAAQSAGRSKHRVDIAGITFWCASGHKGLYGAPGVGLLYVAPGYELEPLVSGGTGSSSDQLAMPGAFPDHLEAGTGPGPAIAALGAGCRWLKEIGVKTVSEREDMLVQRFVAWATSCGFLNVLGDRMSGGTGVVSFEVAGRASDVVAKDLDEKYGIAVRSGLHCAVSAHESIGTASGGTVRASFGYFNSPEEVDYLCRALSEIASGRS